MITGKQAIAEAYQQDKLADDYVRSRYQSDPFGHALHQRQVRLLRRIVRRLGVRRLLEVAPGPARLTVELPPVEFACAVEQSAAMLRVAREQLEARGNRTWNLIQGDAFQLPLEARQFDLVMSFKLLRHFGPEDRVALLRNVRRVLRPQGHFVLDVPHEPACRWLHAKWGVEGKGWIDDYWFTADQFRREMREAGFPHVRLFPVHPALKLQYYLWAYVWRASPLAARAAGRLLEAVSVGLPLEWIALCRCA
jgi:SAM-dependent methyltransferase